MGFSGDAHGCGTEDVALMGNTHPARKTRKRVLNYEKRSLSAAKRSDLKPLGFAAPFSSKITGFTSEDTA